MIPFIDLATQQKKIRERVETALLKILDHGKYIMGPEIQTLESQLSSFCGAKHTLSCSNGTDALILILMAKNVKAGDAVFVPSFTFCATAEVVACVGATPIFIDCLPDTFNMDPASLEKGIEKAKELNLRPCCVIPVDLFGQPADYDTITPIAKKHGMWVLGDAAQSIGGSYKGRPVGTLGDATSTSFFPAKPLGCYGDGGAVFTDDKDLCDIMTSIRIHGKGSHKYENVRIGMNGRMDTMQAAVLIEKLAIFPDEIKARQKVADRYSAGLKDVATTPYVLPNCQSIWAQYTLKVDPSIRDNIMEELKKEGIPAVVYYPLPLHHQEAYKHFPCATDSLPVCEELAHCVISLPMHAYLEEDVQDRIIKAFCEIATRLQAKKVA